MPGIWSRKNSCSVCETWLRSCGSKSSLSLLVELPELGVSRMPSKSSRSVPFS